MLALNRPYSPWIHLAGTERRGSRWAVVQRVVAHYVLVVNYQGTEDIVIAGNAYEIPEKGAYLVQPGVFMERIGSQKGSRPAWIHFDLIYNERRNEHKNTYSFDGLEGREHLLQPTAKSVWGVDLPVLVPKALLPMFTRSVDTIVRRWLTGDPYDQLFANHELLGLLHAWVQYELPRSLETLDIAPETRLRRAEANARLNLAKNYGVDDFARAAGLGRAQFARIFKQVRGLRPGEALRDMRIGEAERLLRTTQLSIQEIGRRVGYPNITVLARLFRKRHGLSPTEWREMHR